MAAYDGLNSGMITAHFVPDFHGFGFPGLNLVEAGQSTMCKKMLTLVDATFDNIIKQM